MGKRGNYKKNKRKNKKRKERAKAKSTDDSGTSNQHTDGILPAASCSQSRDSTPDYTKAHNLEQSPSTDQLNDDQTHISAHPPSDASVEFVFPTDDSAVSSEGHCCRDICPDYIAVVQNVVFMVWLYVKQNNMDRLMKICQRYGVTIFAEVTDSETCNLLVNQRVEKIDRVGRELEDLCSCTSVKLQTVDVLSHSGTMQLLAIHEVQLMYPSVLIRTAGQEIFFVGKKLLVQEAKYDYESLISQCKLNRSEAPVAIRGKGVHHYSDEQENLFDNQSNERFLKNTDLYSKGCQHDADGMNFLEGAVGSSDKPEYDAVDNTVTSQDDPQKNLCPQKEPAVVRGYCPDHKKERKPTRMIKSDSSI